VAALLPLWCRHYLSAAASRPCAIVRTATVRQPQLAISRVGYIHRILLPFAAPGISGALVLSAGRALAETAVLLFTAGYVMRWPESLFDSGRTLAVHIYDLP